MTTTTLTLTDFLLARIAERERRVGEIPDWYCTDSARGEGWGSRGDCPLCLRYMSDGTESVTEEAFWEHMEDVHERTFILAECEAKRRIVDHLRSSAPWTGGGPTALAHFDGFRSGMEFVLRKMAAVYADHPDFSPDWA